VLARPGSGGRSASPLGGVISATHVPIHRPAPAPDGPIACTPSPNEYAGRLEDFRHGVFTIWSSWSGPPPTRLRLLLAGDPEAVRELLVREQGCCAFLSFALTPDDGRLVADRVLTVARRQPALPGPSPSGLGPRR
jgi:hypothetical protein